MTDEEYHLVATSKESEEDGESTILHRDVRELDSEEAAEVNESRRAMNQFLQHTSVFKMCAANFQEIGDYYDDIFEEYARTQRTQATSNQIVQEMNRRIMNYLSSFRTYLDYTERRLSAEHESHFLKMFREATSEAFDSAFAYRFCYHLRNYVQHRGLPIGQFILKASEIADGSVETDGDFYFDRDALLEDHDWHRRVAEDLSHQSPEFPVMPLLEEHFPWLMAINAWSLAADLRKYAEHNNRLAKMLEEAQQAYPGSQPVLIDYRRMQVDDGPVSIGILNFPTEAMAEFQRAYEFMNAQDPL